MNIIKFNPVGTCPKCGKPVPAGNTLTLNGKATCIYVCAYCSAHIVPKLRLKSL